MNFNYLKILITLCIIYLLSNNAFAQVGIGHTTPYDKTKLDINGKLLIRDVEVIEIKPGDTATIKLFPIVTDPATVPVSGTTPLVGGGGVVKSYKFTDFGSKNLTFVYNTFSQKWEVKEAGTIISIVNTGDVLGSSDGNGNWTLTLKPCAEDEVLIFKNGKWTCGAAATQVTVGDGLENTGGVISLKKCQNGEFLLTEGGVWVCKPFPVPLTCANGQTLVYNNGKWECAASGVNFIAKGPLQVVSGPAGQPDTLKIMNGSTQSGDILVWNATTGVWEVKQSSDINWTLQGNSIRGPEYIGTNNNMAFRIRSNNVERMTINPNGTVLLNPGNNTPNGLDELTINGASNGAALLAHGNGANGLGVYATSSDAKGIAALALGNGLNTVNAPAEGAGLVAGGSSFGAYVFSQTTNPTNPSYGLFGETMGISANASGIVGSASEKNPAGATFGVVGESYGNTTQSSGVRGVAYGSVGLVSGVYGSSHSGANFSSGLEGFSVASRGITFGVLGTSMSPTPGAAGVMGQAREGLGGTYGVYGTSDRRASLTAGVFGHLYGSGDAGATYYGVAGVADKSAPASTQIGVYGSAPNPGMLAPNHTEWAGYFNGCVFGLCLEVAGYKNFKIDHPLDPANKYLTHTCPESPEALNIYTGNATTNANGEVTVQLPAYFEKINKDFRYSLTCVGQAAQAFVQSKISNNQFVIKTDKPNVEVSWMITGVRNDLYAQKHPVQAESEKAAQHKGKYVLPELYGKGNEAAIVPAPKVDTQALENFNAKEAVTRATNSVSGQLKKKTIPRN